ncbi:hypothetical protein BURPS1655_D0991 [Burkholderia pseudomallei 1655]|nr:hypothetical protein CXQ84_34410 [Burkholderia pseudomallei]EDU12127.1 hypothetical protein BURPS1655_D0991 [Burkholderia pseudomallei 1655]
MWTNNRIAFGKEGASRPKHFPSPPRVAFESRLRRDTARRSMGGGSEAAPQFDLINSTTKHTSGSSIPRREAHERPSCPQPCRYRCPEPHNQDRRQEE